MTDGLNLGPIALARYASRAFEILPSGDPVAALVTNRLNQSVMLSLTDYRRSLAIQGLAPNTVHQRVEFAERCLREWGTLDVDAELVADWLGKFHGWTKRTYYQHLVSLFRWLTSTGQIAESPLAQYRAPSQPRARPKPLATAELVRALDVADGDLRTWMLLAYLAGLRVHEIAKFRGEDIDQDVLYVTGKGGQEAMLPTHPTLWVIAQTYPREGYWFPSPQYRCRDHVSEVLIGSKVRAHFREIGVRSGSIHRLRHSYGTMLARSGAHTRVVQELMRHASLATTQMYLEARSEDKARAVNLLDPTGRDTMLPPRDAAA